MLALVLLLAIPAVDPPGWHALPSVPDQGQFDCVIHGAAQGNWWHVEAPGGVIRIIALHQSDTDDPVPFNTEVTGKGRRKGRRHALHVPGGWLVGFDAGEFGGSFWWFSEDGARRHELRLNGEKESVPVTGIVQL